MFNNCGQAFGGHLSFALRGDVAKYHYHPEQRAIRVPNRRGSVANWSFLAILRNEQSVIRKPGAPASTNNPFDRIFDRLARLFTNDMKHLRQRLPLRFGIFPTSEPFRFGIQKSDVAFLVCDDDRVTDAGDGRDEQVARFGQFSLSAFALYDFVHKPTSREMHCVDRADDQHRSHKERGKRQHIVARSDAKCMNRLRKKPVRGQGRQSDSQHSRSKAAKPSGNGDSRKKEDKWQHCWPDTRRQRLAAEAGKHNAGNGDAIPRPPWTLGEISPAQLFDTHHEGTKLPGFPYALNHCSRKILAREPATKRVVALA